MDRLEQIEISRRARPIIRAAVVNILAYIKSKEANGGDFRAWVPDVVKEVFPKDRDVELITNADLIKKTAVVPTSMTNATGFIETVGVPDFFNMLGPASAGSVVLQSSSQFSFDGVGQIMIPGIVAAAANAGFVTEGNQIPVRQLVFDDVLLTPRKLAAISVFSRELFLHSIPTIEDMVKMVMSESVGFALDAALFDITAGDATRPAGLREGISTLTPSVLTPRSEAMAADIAALITSVAPVAGNNRIILIAAPAQAAALRLWNNANFNYTVLASSGLVAGTVIAIATNALVSASDPVPRFSVSDQATLHMDTAPTGIGVAGTPPTVAAPTRSLWQTDSLALRTIFETSWALRNPAGLAYIDLVSW